VYVFALNLIIRTPTTTTTHHCRLALHVCRNGTRSFTHAYQRSQDSTSTTTTTTICCVLAINRRRLHHTTYSLRLFVRFNKRENLISHRIVSCRAIAPNSALLYTRRDLFVFQEREQRVSMLLLLLLLLLLQPRKALVNATQCVHRKRIRRIDLIEIGILQERQSRNAKERVEHIHHIARPIGDASSFHILPSDRYIHASEPIHSALAAALSWVYTYLTRKNKLFEFVLVQPIQSSKNAQTRQYPPRVTHLAHQAA
jgi:hypothetical protein